MSAKPTQTVQIYLLGKEYQISCNDNNLAELKQAAQYLDAQMRSIRDTGKIIGLERIAVMAALNLSHEVMTSQKTLENHITEQEKRLKKLNAKLETVLMNAKQIDLNTD